MTAATGTLRPAAARARHARARRVRARDGVQRDLGLGGARQRRPDGLPQAAGHLRVPRPRAHALARSRFDYHRLRTWRPRCSSRRSRSAPPCSSLARRSTARTAGSFSARPASSPPSSRSSPSACSRRLHLARRPRAAHVRRAPAAARARSRGIFCALILLEPDLGTTISLCVMMLAHPPRRRRAGATARRCRRSLAVALGLLAIWVEPYRRARVFSFLDPWSDAQGAGFQIVQAMIGIGSGGIDRERPRRGRRRRCSTSPRRTRT